MITLDIVCVWFYRSFWILWMMMKMMRRFWTLGKFYHEVRYRTDRKMFSQFSYFSPTWPFQRGDCQILTYNMYKDSEKTKIIIMTDFRRQNLMSVDVKFWCLKSIPVLKKMKMYNGCRRITYVFKWSGKSKLGLSPLWCFQIEKNPHGLCKNKSALFRVKWPCEIQVGAW